MTEQEILNDFVSKGVSLGLEYARGAEGVTALYVYAAYEEGEAYAEVFFEQAGRVLYPSDVRGVDNSESRIRQIHALQFQDLLEANDAFERAGVPLPTEYRIYYETGTGTLDVQISREIKFANHPTKIMEQGIEDWLGDRAPKLF
ncbi:MAG: hypothetical protein QM677_04040 [Microbacterium sp.]